MSAAPLHSLCQTLDTACVSRVLLKNYCICMTKADGFRVLKREGGVEGLKGGRRQTGTLGQTHWDRWLSPSQETRNSIGYAGYWSRGTGWGVWTRFGFDHTTQWSSFPDYSKRLSAALGENGESATMNQDINSRIFENYLLKSDTLTRSCIHFVTEVRLDPAEILFSR